MMVGVGGKVLDMSQKTQYRYKQCIRFPSEEFIGLCSCALTAYGGTSAHTSTPLAFRQFTLNNERTIETNGSCYTDHVCNADFRIVLQTCSRSISMLGAVLELVYGLVEVDLARE